MTNGHLSRRKLAGMGAAAALCPAAARAMSVVVGSESRIPDTDVYVPPASLKTVVDNYSRMRVSVRVADSGPLAFVVDTGANRTVIAAELATQLGLPVQAPAPLNGVAGMMMAPTSRTTIEVGGRRVETTLSLLPESALGASGLLGLDLLGDRRLTLDFKQRALRLSKSSRWFEGGGVLTKGRLVDGGLTLIEAKIAGMKAVAFLDSGSQNTIGNMALRKLAVDRHAAFAWYTTPIVSATGQTISCDMANLPSFTLGGITLPNWPVAFADLHTFHLWNMIDKPALLLGVDVLSRFETVSLDFGRGEVRFRAPSHDGAMVALNSVKERPWTYAS